MMANDNPTNAATLPVPESFEDMNAFFGDSLPETISRVNSVLQLVQDIEVMRLDARNQECGRLSPGGSSGLHLILECAKAALNKQCELDLAEWRKTRGAKHDRSNR
jgi:hypothetical protein